MSRARGGVRGERGSLRILPIFRAQLTNALTFHRDLGYTQDSFFPYYPYDDMAMPNRAETAGVLQICIECTYLGFIVFV